MGTAGKDEEWGDPDNEKLLPHSRGPSTQPGANGTPSGGGHGARRPSAGVGAAARISRALGVRSGTGRVILAAAVAAAWMFFSNLLILLNKHILKDLKFPYPMTVSSMGMAASGVLSFLACHVFKIADASTQARAGRVSFRFYVTNMLPVGFFMAATLWSGNAVYLHLTVSFIQMLKVAFDAVGVAIMFISAVAESARLVMTQYLLTGLKMGPFEGVMYLGPACFIWLAAGGAAMEWGDIARAGALSVARAHWALFLAAACMGFLINVLAFATIKLASSLTLKVLGTVKNALLIVAAMALYGEVVTGPQAWGYLISTAAFIVYTRVKVMQIAAGG
ncbi:MAG: triose-phosphate transporter family-domain-containing protein [Monoraphidium minutum]|nr:MAG: triose-phosphate transporter family-domain-containing protein [Monoraphidium minutum]